jgi:outer membrane usher protein FimD/PapC
MERIQVNNYGEPTLLNKGLSTYALSIGYPFSSTPDNAFSLIDTSWYQRNLSQDPIISGYYQLGLSDQVTGNLNVQSSPKWTRLGSQATWASNFGILNLNTGINALHTSGERDLKFKA